MENRQGKTDKKGDGRPLGQTSFILAPHIELNYLNNNHNNHVQRTYYVSSTITMTLQISIDLSNYDVR